MRVGNRGDHGATQAVADEDGGWDARPILLLRCETDQGHGIFDQSSEGEVEDFCFCSDIGDERAVTASREREDAGCGESLA